MARMEPAKRSLLTLSIHLSFLAPIRRWKGKFVYHSFRKIRQLPRVARKLENMHAGIGAVDDVDVASVVDLDVVGLNRHFTGFAAARGRHAALVEIGRASCRERV